MSTDLEKNNIPMCSATIDIGQKFRKKKREIGKNLIE